MAVFLLLLLLFSGGVLSISFDSQEAYDVLPVNFKKGVNIALEKVNTEAGVQHRFLYFRGVLRSDIRPSDDVYYIFYHFFLKATNCSNAMVDSTDLMVNSSACEFLEDIPLIDCAFCYKTVNDEIQQEPKPYYYCLEKPALTEKIKRKRINHCNRIASGTGAPCCLAEKRKK